MTVLQRRMWDSWCIANIQWCYKHPSNSAVDAEEYSLLDTGNRHTLYGSGDSSNAMPCSIHGSEQGHVSTSKSAEKTKRITRVVESKDWKKLGI